jgi:hypothetical protein
MDGAARATSGERARYEARSRARRKHEPILVSLRVKEHFASLMGMIAHQCGSVPPSVASLRRWESADAAREESVAKVRVRWWPLPVIAAFARQRSLREQP